MAETTWHKPMMILFDSKESLRQAFDRIRIERGDWRCKFRYGHISDLVIRQTSGCQLL